MFRSNFSNSGIKKAPYLVVFDTVPEVKGSVWDEVRYNVSFSNKADCLKFIGKFDVFAQDVYFYADLMYFRLLSVPYYDFEIKYTKRTYLQTVIGITEVRSIIQLGILRGVEVHKVVTAVNEFLSLLLSLCVYYHTKSVNSEVEKIFNHLQLLKEYFNKSWKGACLSKSFDQFSFMKVSL